MFAQLTVQACVFAQYEWHVECLLLIDVGHAVRPGEVGLGMVKRIASAAVGFLLLASCALCQDLQSLPDAPSALVSTETPTNEAHTLNEFVDEARAPLQVAEADVHAGEMRRGGLVASDVTASGHDGEDFDARLHKILYPAAVKQASSSVDDGSLMGRGMHAALRALIAHTDSGSAKLNTGYLLRTMTAVVADAGSTPYWRRHAADSAGDFGSMVGNDAGLNLWHAFAPGIEHVVIKHTPRFVSKIQTRVGHK
jgi:hypothetical protein